VAEARIKDPVYGCVGALFALQQQVRGITCALWLVTCGVRLLYCIGYSSLCILLDPYTPCTVLCALCAVQVVRLQTELSMAQGEISRLQTITGGVPGGCPGPEARGTRGRRYAGWGQRGRDGGHSWWYGREWVAYLG